MNFNILAIIVPNEANGDSLSTNQNAHIIVSRKMGRIILRNGKAAFLIPTFQLFWKLKPTKY